MEQLNLFGGAQDTGGYAKRHRSKAPTFKKSNGIDRIIQEFNTIPHIYRLRTLYALYGELYLLTYDKKLGCLNYYVEDDGTMYAEIDGTQNMEIKDRVIKHIELLRRIRNGEIREDEFDENKTVEAESTILFG